MQAALRDRYREVPIAGKMGSIIQEPHFSLYFFHIWMAEGGFPCDSYELDGAVPLFEAAKEFEVSISPLEQGPGLSAPHKGPHTPPNMMQN